METSLCSLEAKDQNDEAKKTRHFFLKEASFLLCLSIVQKKWSLVRVEVLGKTNRVIPEAKTTEATAKIVAWTDSIDSSINQVTVGCGKTLK